jgi:uncharacterized membrane protein
MPTNLHPLLVHFPIALLLSYVALDWGGRIWKGRAFTEAAWYTLLLGLAGTLVTLITGLIAARGVPADSPALATLNVHKFISIATFAIFSIQAFCYARNRGKYTPGKQALHTVIQLAGVALIATTGYFGGELVYTFGVGVTALIP